MLATFAMVAALEALSLGHLAVAVAAGIGVAVNVVLIMSVAASNQRAAAADARLSYWLDVFDDGVRQLAEPLPANHSQSLQRPARALRTTLTAYLRLGLMKPSERARWEHEVSRMAIEVGLQAASNTMAGHLLSHDHLFPDGFTEWLAPLGWGEQDLSAAYAAKGNAAHDAKVALNSRAHTVDKSFSSLVRYVTNNERRREATTALRSVLESSDKQEET